jgi:hypothetical protein
MTAVFYRYCAPEQYIMSTQTPSAPPPPVAAALSPVLWQMNLPDRFDVYSAGLIMLQMVRHRFSWRAVDKPLNVLLFNLADLT